jgi:LacI family transcriptional regulator
MSIQQLAKDLGLSISTVSRALNGYSDVSEATRERVAARAAALNYTPRPGARSLKSGKSYAVGVILPANEVTGGFMDPMYSSLLGGVSRGLKAGGYNLVVSTNGGVSVPAELELYDQFLRAKWFDGYIVVRTRIQDPRITTLMKHQVPFVTYGRTETEGNGYWVDTDNEQAFFLATQRQIAFGHRNIALLNGPEEFMFAALREKGYTRAMNSAGLRPAPHQVLHGSLTEKAGYDLTEKLIVSDKPPTALLCATDAMAIGAIAACRNHGLLVGQQISVVGYGNSDAGQFCVPQLTTIAHDLQNNGLHLAELLLTRLRGETPARSHFLETVQVIDRSSDGPRT